MAKALRIIIEAPPGRPGESRQLPLFASPWATPHRDLALGNRGVNYGRVVCTCSDFEKHLEDPRFECKHLLAVREAYRLGKINGKSQVHIELETQAMFGDPDAINKTPSSYSIAEKKAMSIPSIEF